MSGSVEERPRPHADELAGGRAVRPRLSMLDAAAIEYVHEQSLRLLAEVGVRVPLARAQTLLATRAPWSTTRRRSCGSRAISSSRPSPACPRPCCSRRATRGKDALLDHTRSFATHDGMGAMCLDHRTGERRPSTARDLREAMIVADALDEIGVLWYTAYPCDEEPRLQSLRGLQAMLAGSGKHVAGRGHRSGRRALRHGDAGRRQPRRASGGPSGRSSRSSTAR